ncbi:hypothetical protein SUGI_0915350 [Cryptomeria japonica]|nr:hypothetical protein SUGI_0915350 [Cryptomeria japonica]
METDNEAPSMVDLPVTDKMRKKRFLIEPWKLMINACKRVLRSSPYGKEPDFEFSPSNSISDHGPAEICLADELFYQGRLLPLSSKSLHSQSTRGTSSGNWGSISQLENGLSSQVMASASPCLSRCRTTPSLSIKWQHFTRGLLNIPPSSSPLSIDGLHKRQRFSSLSSSKSSSFSSKSLSSSSSSSSSSSRQLQLPGKRLATGQGGGSRSSSGCVRQRAEKGKVWRIFWGVGNSCRDSDCIIVTATHLVKHPK